MKITLRLACIVAISVLSYNFSETKMLPVDKQPEFADKGRTIDSLIKVYNCKTIDFTNWQNKTEADSCLLINLVNSTKIPGPDISGVVFEGIASTIKRSLKNPQSYKSFYIIFVKDENVFGQATRLHSNGMELNIADL